MNEERLESERLSSGALNAVNVTTFERDMWVKGAN